MHFQNYLFVSILVFSFICLSRSEEECANVDEDGNCLERCSEGTFLYQPGCENVTMSQQTCRQPVARSLGYICDYSRCDCHEPQLWDEAAKACAMADKCSDQSKVNQEEDKLKKAQENTTYLPYTDE